MQSKGSDEHRSPLSERMEQATGEAEIKKRPVLRLDKAPETRLAVEALIESPR